MTRAENLTDWLTDWMSRFSMLTPMTNKRHKAKTHTIKKNCNPEFKQEFAFAIDMVDLQQKSLEVGVFDKDIGSSDDWIGKIYIWL